MRSQTSRWWEVGVHGLDTNALLDTSWHQVERDFFWKIKRSLAAVGNDLRAKEIALYP